MTLEMPVWMGCIVLSIIGIVVLSIFVCVAIVTWAIWYATKHPQKTKPRATSEEEDVIPTPDTKVDL